MLQPLFPGAWAPAGAALVCVDPAPADAFPVAALLAGPGPIDACLRQHARHLGVVGTDLRATASHWCFAWLDVLLPPVVAAASVLQHAFPVEPESIRVRLGPGAVPLAFYIGHEGRSQRGAHTALRFGPLVDSHLAPLFAMASRQARVAPKILWGNLARRLDWLFDQALQLTGGSASIALDRDWLLQAPSRHDGRPNPLHQPGRQAVRRQGDGPSTLHRHCCLCYRLPRQDYCAACPLAPRRRSP